MNDDQLNSLIKRISDLENIVSSLRNSASIPRDIQTALTTRLAFISSSGTTGTANTQSVSVPSTPTNITVPAQPSGTIAITVKGTVYNVLYK